MANQDLDVLKLKQQEESISYNKLEGTGVRTIRVFSAILIVLGIIFCLIGVILFFNLDDRLEFLYLGIFSISAAISCFVISPFLKVIATIGEAAKIYIDKNITQ